MFSSSSTLLNHCSTLCSGWISLSLSSSIELELSLALGCTVSTLELLEARRPPRRPRRVVRVAVELDVDITDESAEE